MTSFEDVENLWEEIEEEDDIGQKRYLMNHVFDLLLEKTYRLTDSELPEPKHRVGSLQGEEGYLYKLSQDFLTSSSTREKEQKLEKMISYLEKKAE